MRSNLDELKSTWSPSSISFTNLHSMLAGESLSKGIPSFPYSFPMQNSANLSFAFPLFLPANSASFSMLRSTRFIPNAFPFEINSCEYLFLLIETPNKGGSMEIGKHHAAAITFSFSLYLPVIRTTLIG
ncbi:MAG: hypothetical protein NTY83_03235 [Candidatus Micrarchaeota archaeon]|nr:hypothetical protein [Candidatus Micrarchaeota archaeon]